MSFNHQWMQTLILLRQLLNTTTLVGEDTDLLILLLHYSRTDKEVIYFRSDANKQLKERKVYNINLLKETLGTDLCNELLFVHAYSGCDSTSRIFGIGKESAFQKLVKSDPVMKSCASAIIPQNKSQEDISYLGKNLMVDIFGGKSNDTLSSLRHVIFTKKVANAQALFTSERLPPTSPSSLCHVICGTQSHDLTLYCRRPRYKYPRTNHIGKQPKQIV